MNRLLTFAFMLLTSLAITACGSDSATDNTATAPPVTPITTPGAAGAAAGVAAVEHYTCPAGHVGSGGAAAGTCAQCGVTLEHNQAFHGSQPAVTPPGAAAGANPMLQNPGAAPTTTTIAPPTEPAQNAAGVWHYTCGAGCAGGGAAAGPCASCGATLAHNAGYHN